MNAAVDFYVARGQEGDWVCSWSAEACGVGWLGRGWREEVGEGCVGG